MKKKSQASWCRKADKLWGEYVHRDKRCLVGSSCSGPLQAHHLITRSIRHTRHEPANGILLCAFHHKFSPRLSAHGAPLAFSQWLEQFRPDLWQYVRDNKWKVGKPDYEGACKRLEKLLGGKA